MVMMKSWTGENRRNPVLTGAAGFDKRDLVGAR